MCVQTFSRPTKEDTKTFLRLRVLFLKETFKSLWRFEVRLSSDVRKSLYVEWGYPVGWEYNLFLNPCPNFFTFQPPSVDRRSTNSESQSSLFGIHSEIPESQSTIVLRVSERSESQSTIVLKVSERSERRNTSRGKVSGASESLSTDRGWKAGRNTAYGTIHRLRIKEYEHYIYRQH